MRKLTTPHAAVSPLLLLLLVGCNQVWATSPAQTEKEVFVVAETARISGILGQRVQGQISTTFYQVKCSDGTSPCHATGWYDGKYGKGAKGTAYYYQFDVNQFSHQTLTGLAAHEVCHSVTGVDHDEEHNACQRRANGS